ncbi:MAG: phenylalanine--tRNA ligase subunit beta [Chitinophagaceae bacterium]|nr:phenylalanine--tRNA ligase subunit beta [Chitinophagaceae bacterium]MCW5904027.1 phenylalanine--tRNA ligase subunit beta [Chitinophagaceae bacterium]
MTISYNWLNEYLPEQIEPEKLSKILTSVGLEVESMEHYESMKGGLKGLVIGEVLNCEPHPNADKLKITSVNIAAEQPLQIVCGASNVAQGQKVVVATIGSTIFPIQGEPLTMKIAKIRGVESYGMICAEDEIGLSENHEGIMVLPNDVVVGTPAAEYFKPYSDIIFEIGLTPNRMDAMSHFGVAKDVCAYLTHHNNQEYKPKNIFTNGFKADNQQLPIQVTVENTDACPRYAGVSISGIEVKESPEWLKNKLTAIGVKCINNIVDITNYFLHETGQPLHAFDANAIANNHVIVKKLAKETPFITLDEKERKLSENDIIICDGNEKPMCIGGVFGGLNSGIKSTTQNIFLESACFDATTIRKTSMLHNLRTDAATRFEKGVDIGNTVYVLQRAATLIKEIAGGNISSNVVDIYPIKKEKKEVSLKLQYLKKLSGKNYHPDTVKRILTALGFDLIKESIDEIRIAVPYSKPDITFPADIVEEIVRIDGLDNIDIPSSITITPQTNSLGIKNNLKDKIAYYLTGLGFNEILTNSITNSKYYSEETLQTTVKMLNNLSADLDILKPTMLETGLEVLAYNLNRKNNHLKLFEFGKTYSTTEVGKYTEQEHLSLYLTGAEHEDYWNIKSKKIDFYTAKGIAKAIVELIGVNAIHFQQNEHTTTLDIYTNKKLIGTLQEVSTKQAQQFDIKQPVYYIDFNYNTLVQEASAKKIMYKEMSKFPSVQRDVALIVDKNITYHQIEEVVKKLKLSKLQNIRLFDVFESNKLGNDKKSMAVNFTFIDEEKTLTDKEIDNMMNKLIKQFENDLSAEIRK